MRPFITTGRCACVTPRPGAFPIWTSQFCPRTSMLATTATRWTCRSKWPTAVCRSYTTAMAQQPKPAPSSKPKLKQSTSQRKKPTTDPDSIEEQLKALDQMRRMPSVYTTTDFWGSPMASFGLCICSGCGATLTQWTADVQIPYDIRMMLNTLFTQRPYQLRKVKDVWFATRHNINNWLKNTFG